MSILNTPNSIPESNVPASNATALIQAEQVVSLGDVQAAEQAVLDAERILATTIRRHVADQLAVWQSLPCACLRVEIIKNPDADYHAVERRRCYRYGFWDLTGYGQVVDCSDGQLKKVGDRFLSPLPDDEVVKLVRRPDHQRVSFDAAAVLAELRQEADRLMRSLTRGGRIDMQDRIDQAMRINDLQEVYVPRQGFARAPGRPPVIF